MLTGGISVFILPDISQIYTVQTKGCTVLNSIDEIGAVGQAAAANLPGLSVGLMTLEKFAEAVGLPPGVVLGHLNRGILPTVTLGRRRLINVVALQRELARKEFAL